MTRVILDVRGTQGTQGSKRNGEGSQRLWQYTTLCTQVKLVMQLLLSPRLQCFPPHPPSPSNCEFFGEGTDREDTGRMSNVKCQMDHGPTCEVCRCSKYRVTIEVGDQLQSFDCQCGACKNFSLLVTGRSRRMSCIPSLRTRFSIRGRE